MATQYADLMDGPCCWLCGNHIPKKKHGLCRACEVKTGLVAVKN